MDEEEVDVVKGEMPEKGTVEVCDTEVKIIQVPGAKIKCPKCGNESIILDPQFIQMISRGVEAQFPCPTCKAILRHYVPKVQIVPGNVSIGKAFPGVDELFKKK